jgi:hypothetical protein
MVVEKKEKVELSVRLKGGYERTLLVLNCSNHANQGNQD